MSSPTVRGPRARTARSRALLRVRIASHAVPDPFRARVSRRLRAPVLAATLVVVPSGVGAAPPPSRAPVSDDCATELDRAVHLARSGAAADAARRLEALSRRCAHLPQIEHDLGVLAARAGRTRAAIAHFEASLAADPRAADTLAQLRALHRHEAAVAYARALDVSPAVPSPELALQDSSAVNADSLRPAADDGELRTLVAVEYELYDWWHSADAPDPAGWLAHYAEDYPEEVALADRARLGRTPWERVRREVAFTAEDAVAVLEHETHGALERRLLLLRLQGKRWKIYRETPL